MPYDKNTVDDVGRALKQAPGDLKVMILDDGLCYPITKIKTCYVIPTTDWTKAKCYTEADEHEKGAMQIMLIE